MEVLMFLLFGFCICSVVELIVAIKRYQCCPWKKREREIARLHKAISKALQALDKTDVERKLEKIFREEYIILPRERETAERNHELTDENFTLTQSNIELMRHSDEMKQKYNKLLGKLISVQKAQKSEKAEKP